MTDIQHNSADSKIMQRLLDAAGWDAGSVRHKQLEDALTHTRLRITDDAQPSALRDAVEALLLTIRSVDEETTEAIVRVREELNVRPPAASATKECDCESAADDSGALVMVVCKAQAQFRASAVCAQDQCEARAPAIVQRIKEACAQVADRAMEGARSADRPDRAAMAQEIAASIRALIPGAERQAVPTREQIAKAIYDVANRWIAPNFPKGHKLRTFDEIDGQDLALHMDYADAVLALSRANPGVGS